MFSLFRYLHTHRTFAHHLWCVSSAREYRVTLQYGFLLVRRVAVSEYSFPFLQSLLTLFVSTALLLLLQRFARTHSIILFHDKFLLYTSEWWFFAKRKPQTQNTTLRTRSFSRLLLCVAVKQMGGKTRFSVFKDKLLSASVVCFLKKWKLSYTYQLK